MKLIKIQDKFILVSDEEIKEGTLFIHPDKTIERASRDLDGGGLNKIIAGIEFLPSIDFSLLSEEDCKTIGWVDIYQLAFNECGNDSNGKANFIRGFKTAQSLNDKMFSLEDIDNAYIQGRNDESISGNKKKMRVDYLQSLQQTEWDVEVNELNQITKTL